jgi:GT2 family glycosyltransferase
VVSRARNLLVKDMLDAGSDYLMFIDSDINFEPDDIFRLMAWAQDSKKGIVAGVPRVRDAKKTYIADLDHDENGDLTMNAMGLVRGKRVATAFMLIQRSVITDMMAANPDWNYFDKRCGKEVPALFDFKLTAEGYIGEDFLFCDRTRELGYEVWIDPTIALGHMGVQEYTGHFGEDILYPMVAPQKDVV